MKLGNIEIDLKFLRTIAGLMVAMVLAATASMSIAGCSLFDSAPVREKVVQHPVAKTTDPYRDRQRR